MKNKKEIVVGRGVAPQYKNGLISRGQYYKRYIESTNGTYVPVLPIASKTQKGIVQVGENLDVTDGVIDLTSVDGGTY